MDQENMKRKNLHDANKEAPDHKIRKTNSIETASYAGIINKSSATAQIVELWQKGLSGTTQKDRDNSFNAQEIDGKYKEAVKMIEFLKKKLSTSQENSRELSISMKEITAENETLRDKLSKAETLTNEFSNIVEYISDTLDRNREQFKDLQFIKILNERLEEEKKNLNNEINKLNEKLNTNEKKYQDALNVRGSKLMEVKSKLHEIESKMKEEKEQKDKINNKLEEKQKEILTIKLNEDKLRNTITDLENRLSEEKKKIDCLTSNTNEKMQEIKDIYERELFEAHKNSEKVETEVKTLREEKDNMVKILENKAKSIEFFEKKVEEHEKKIKTLLEQVSETETSFQQCVHDKENVKKELEEKNIELLRLAKNINSLTLDKQLLNDQLKNLNDKLINEEKERIKLADDLIQKNVELQEALRKNQEIEQSYRNNDESKDSVINNLNRDMKKMEKELDKITKERTLERQEANKNLKRLETSHEKEMNDLRTKCEKYLADYYKASNAKNNALKENLESKMNLTNLTNDLKLQKEVYSKKIEELNEELAKKIAHLDKLEEDLEKMKTTLTNLEKRNKELEKGQEKENEHQYRLERKISCLDAMVKTLTPSQEMVNKNVRIQKDEITTTRTTKSILKSPTAERNFKTPKLPGKKIYFVNLNDQHEFENIHRSQPVMNNQDNVNLSLLRSSQPATPSPSDTSIQSTPSSTPRKFFKSRTPQKK